MAHAAGRGPGPLRQLRKGAELWSRDQENLDNREPDGFHKAGNVAIINPERVMQTQSICLCTFSQLVDIV